jgi:hypothetical protein
MPVYRGRILFAQASGRQTQQIAGEPNSIVKRNMVHYFSGAEPRASSIDPQLLLCRTPA